MSETEKQRMSLVGVGPKSRSLKFLNAKNNIADKCLTKKLMTIDKQRAVNLNVIEHEKINAKQFIKHIRSLEHDSEEVQTLMQRDDFGSVTPPPRMPHDRRRRKIRLAQTAPAQSQHKKGQHLAANARGDRTLIRSGPETLAEKNKMLDTDRKKSVFIQLSGSGRQRDYSNEDGSRKVSLPKPNPKTLLDVMIGLNAFSYVPSPTHRSADFTPEFRSDTRPTYRSADFTPEFRSDTRNSYFERDSLYGSSENIAQKFLTNWKSKIASRKQSIFQKLEAKDKERNVRRSDSIATTCIPEESSLNNSFRKRKSKWIMHHSMRQSILPAIDDDDERMEQFHQYMRESKEKERCDIHPAFANAGTDKTSERRKSFVQWLTDRKNRPKNVNDFDDSDDEDTDELTYKGISLVQKDDDFQPTDIGDLMKTILKIKTHFRDPLDSRVRKFLKEVDALKLRDDTAQRDLSEKERKRRWMALTRGIDAALAESSDDDDDDDDYY